MEIRKINEAEQREIEEYLTLDEDLLYSLIPAYLPEYDKSAFNITGQIAAGRKYIEKLRHELHRIICVDWQLCAKIDHPNFKDSMNVVVVVGDAIAAKIAGVPPFLVASILAKIGLRKFCNCK